MPDCIKAIDETFQPSYKRGATNKAKKVWVSGKHSAPGMKTEVAVGPDGRARYASNYSPGSVHDFVMFKQHIDEHLDRLIKQDGNNHKQDNMSVDAIEKQNQWGAMMDKGYVGAAKLGRFIVPKKRKPGKKLSDADKRRNNKIEADRAIVENFFGRMKCLWDFMERCYRLDERKYNAFFKMCVGLTNYHISLMPLRREDGKVERNYHRRLIDLKKMKDKKRKAQLENARATRRARYTLAARTFGEDGEMLSIGDSDEWSNSNDENAKENSEE